MRKDEARRLALSNRPKDNKEISKLIVDDIYDSRVLDNYDNIGIYYPLGKEIDIMDIMNKYPNKTFYLPKTDKFMYFIKYEFGDKLVDGPFKTKEPEGMIVPINTIECFLIPCVAISKDNKRVGYGKGYYDRYLKNYNGLKIGICYNNASDMDIDMDIYDVKLDMKFTR